MFLGNSILHMSVMALSFETEIIEMGLFLPLNVPELAFAQHPPATLTSER